MPAQHLGLLLFGVANRVHPEFAKDERLVIGEVLQAREVAVEIVLAVEIDIESDEVAVLREQVFRWRVARVGEQGLGIGFAADVDELFDELRDLARAEPANHRGGNFVANEVAENGGMPCVFGNPVAHSFLGCVADGAVVKKFQMLGPRDRNQGTDAEFLAEIEKPTRRHIVNAHEIHPGLAHQFEINAGFFRIAEMLPLGIGRERPVGYAFDEKLFVALEEKLRTDTHGLRIAHGRRV